MLPSGVDELRVRAPMTGSVDAPPRLVEDRGAVAADRWRDRAVEHEIGAAHHVALLPQRGRRPAQDLVPAND